MRSLYSQREALHWRNLQDPRPEERSLDDPGRIKDWPGEAYGPACRLPGRRFVGITLAYRVSGLLEPTLAADGAWMRWCGAAAEAQRCGSIISNANPQNISSTTGADLVGESECHMLTV